MKIGIIREGKVPPDARVALTPSQVQEISQKFNLNIRIEPSPNRCFSDKEYHTEGGVFSDDLSDCDVLLGIKEVPITQLIAEKTYFFFSHTIKKQTHNRKLLQAVLEKKIRLIDYEMLTDAAGNRLIAFGKFAGMVGAHNGLLAYGIRTGKFSLPRMKDLHDFDAVCAVYQNTPLPPLKVVVTGNGRVSSGIVYVLQKAGVKMVAPADFLNVAYDYPVFTQLSPVEYARRKDGSPFQKKEYYAQPQDFESAFAPYFREADIFVNGIFYDKNAPAFFTNAEMLRPDFKIKVIADVSCDLMPHSSVPSTLYATTIAEPFYGYNPANLSAENEAFTENVVTMMTIDNLPSELPRDASAFFGEQFIEHILPEVLRGGYSDILERATIAENGALTPRYAYLQDYVNEQ